MDKAAHSGFETQRRCHQKSETGVPVAPKNGKKNLKRKEIVSPELMKYFCATFFSKIACFSELYMQSFSVIDFLRLHIQLFSSYCF